MEKGEAPHADGGFAISPTSSSFASHSVFPEIQSEFFSKSPEFGSNFASMYHSIFPPKSQVSLTPSPCCSSSSSSCDGRFLAAAAATEHRLNQARIVLEYQELLKYYDLCRARIQELSEELDSLRLENADLRLANAELVKLLSFSPNAAALQSAFNRQLNIGTVQDTAPRFTGEVSGLSPTSVMEQNRFENQNTERVTLPKSISVRSSGYLKMNQPRAIASDGALNRATTSQQAASPLLSGSQRVYVPLGKREAEALELDVYNQGMSKTELCNKWQQTGMCPYGDHCQFAHGITELRPVIRHPRYKTQVCRMVLAGDTCPYGHRCHFRHALTDQERMLGRIDG